MYCDSLIWHVSCTVVVLTCFVMFGCVCVGFVLCGCIDNCVGLLLIFLRVFTVVLFSLCIFILICCVCTSLRATAPERKLNFSK